MILELVMRDTKLLRRGRGKCCWISSLITDIKPPDIIYQKLHNLNIETLLDLKDSTIGEIVLLMLVSNDIIHRSSHQKPKLASASCHCVFRISVTFNGNNTMKYFLNNSVTTSTIKLKLLIINQTLMAPFSSILFF